MGLRKSRNEPDCVHSKQLVVKKGENKKSETSKTNFMCIPRTN